MEVDARRQCRRRRRALVSAMELMTALSAACRAGTNLRPFAAAAAEQQWFRSRRRGLSSSLGQRAPIKRAPTRGTSEHRPSASERGPSCTWAREFCPVSKAVRLRRRLPRNISAEPRQISISRVGRFSLGLLVGWRWARARAPECACAAAAAVAAKKPTAMVGRSVGWFVRGAGEQPLAAAAAAGSNWAANCIRRANRAA